MEILFIPEFWFALATLSVLEIILGIDNVVFLSIIVQNLPSERQPKARTVGLLVAMFMRIGLLLTLSFILTLDTAFTSIGEVPISIKSIILMAGGLFLLTKATHEIHNLILVKVIKKSPQPSKQAFWWVIVQIVIIDLVFSVDSVITAIGMTHYIQAMIAAIIISILVMLLAAGAISDLISRYPTLKVLALAFLILVGVALIVEAIGQTLPKGYIYFAMFFSFAIEILNIKVLRNKEQS